MRGRRSFFLRRFPLPPCRMSFSWEGEFASRLDEGFARERPWLKIVPGCELYVPGWTALMLPDENGGGS